MNKKIKQCRQRRLFRVRKKLKTINKNRYRLSVFKSNCNLYAQIIDDSKSHTLLGVSTLGQEFEDDNKKNKSSVKYAKKLGKILSDCYKDKKIDKNIFLDRGIYKYCGVVRALVESMRSCGINF